MSPSAALRARREAACLKALADGPKSRGDVAGALAFEGDPISEHTVHACMQRLEERGQVRIDKVRIKGMFGKFRWDYVLLSPDDGCLEGKCAHRETDGWWEHCSPQLLQSGYDCAKGHRRVCACPGIADGVHMHDHFVPTPRSAERVSA